MKPPSMKERLFAFTILTPFTGALSECPAFSPPGEESPAEARHPPHESALGFILEEAYSQRGLDTDHCKQVPTNVTELLK
jgi:hypothetical protein